MNVNDSISLINGVGKKKEELFNKLGIYTVFDLLFYFPRAYENWSNEYSIDSAPLNEKVCIKAYVGSTVREHFIRKGMTTYSLDITDGKSVMDIVFFNNKYAASALEMGKEYRFFGKINSFGKYHKSMNSPQFVPVSGDAGKMRPIYPQSAGLSSRQIEKVIKTAIDSLTYIPDCLPDNIRKDYCLMTGSDAFHNVHFPENEDYLIEAKRRLVFEELFLLQIGLLRLKIKAAKQTSIVIKTDCTDEFLKLLPFTLTGAQKRAINEGMKDMATGKPMNRLLQGDVGSGKTAVCAAIIYNVIKNGYQASLMAPTEVLANQHYKTFLKFFEKTDIKIALLTGSLTQKEKNAIKKDLADGKTDLIIGTHAVIQKDVVFKNLGIAVTDEQHRFGVNQRGLLTAKGNNPHVLVMSATPIPRTLSLIIYGDLDLSILDEMPAGRQKTETFLINSDIKERAYGYVKKHLCDGFQGYIVCPLIDTDEETDSEVASSVEIYNNLKDGYFRGFRLGLLHGKMSPSDKKKVMNEFSEGKTDLLISTTVIEVGVDVPNAVIMVIENAEHFGLSQLHQLRGRIGRGSTKSTCILISDNESDKTNERLKILTDTTDGFKIADEDLRLRGPGDFFGSRQHGLPNLKIAGLISDAETVRETHIAAEKLLKSNPDLSGDNYNLIKSRVNKMFSHGLILN